MLDVGSSARSLRKPACSLTMQTPLAAKLEKPAADFALELRHVTKYFGDFKAVDDVSFSLPAGSIYGFLGPNGAGKTTTIRMILDIIKPTTGSLEILGTP